MKPLVYLLFAAAAWAGQTRYARLAEFAGSVEVQLAAADAWEPAARNLPLAEGSWLRTAAAARLEVQIDDGAAWRLGPESLGEISDYTRLSTGQRITLLSLDHGLAYVTGEALGGDSFLVAVPGAQVSLGSAARVRLEAGPDWSEVSVLAGSVHFTSPAVELDLPAGRSARVEPAHPSRFFLDPVITEAGPDSWSASRDEALLNTISALHVGERCGLADLDSAGEWVHTEEFGVVWKPKVDVSWAPFQRGLWRWYAPLGFTWVSGDSWGWLPYHYGRWVHRGELGWLWVPGLSHVFKPGEVYWLRGPKFAAWGPLAPGEPYPPLPDAVPQQFFDAYTTYAPFPADAFVIDPAGFAARPKEPLKMAVFAAALPSPPLPASRLDAGRPVLAAGHTRVEPQWADVAYQGSADVRIPRDAPPTPPSVAEPPEEALPAGPTGQAEDAVAVPVPYPLLVFIQRARSTPKPGRGSPAGTSAPRPVADVPPAAPPSPAHPPADAPPARRWPPGEYLLFQKALSASNPKQQLAELANWKERYPVSEHEAERVFCYIQAYSRFTPPLSSSLVESAAPLVGRDPRSWFDATESGRAQALAILYLVAVSAARVPGGNTNQLRICHWAARQLLECLPEFFAESSRPTGVSEQMWRKARADMESSARQTLALASVPRAAGR